MYISWHPCYNHPVPEGHRFPMLKYDLLPEQLLYEGTINESMLHRPQAITNETLLLAHDTDYIQRLNEGTLTPHEIRRTGFAWSEQLVRREEIIMQGTLDAALYALSNGVGFNIAGGTHHAYRNRGEGFCLYNDQAIAALYLLKSGKAKRIFILDLDVHQGNGTASILQDEPDIFTFSMHGGNNYPMVKEQSDLDIPLPDKCNDALYHQLLEEYFYSAIEKFEPDFLFFQSGVDVLASDKLGKLGLSHSGCKARDEKIIQWAHRHKVPLCVSMGGGYSVRIQDIVNAHAEVFRLAMHYYF
jgi:acetoin utilization deacetylase AcuC-like enzyme